MSKFILSYGALFKTRSRENAAVAARYLSGLAQAEDCNFAAMADVVDQGCAQQFQHFISNSPWDHEGVLAQLGRDADGLVGGTASTCLIIDESSFAKQGERSVGVARQWSGRQGKVDKCQVAVLAVLTNGEHHVPVDMRLYLPKAWIADPARCDKAGIPPDKRVATSKSAHALTLVEQARRQGLRFGWVGVDAGYGKEPAFLLALDERHEVFVADVHRTQQMWTDCPVIGVPASKPGRGGGRATKPRAATASVSVQSWAAGVPASDWTRHILRDGTRGDVHVDIAHRRVWLWDGRQAKPRCWHLIVRREVKDLTTLKYSLSNALNDTTVLRLAQMQGQRYWVERTFEDAKGQCGLADYQAVGWRAWHHHVTMVMLAMLFIAQQRVANKPLAELLSPRDIVDILKETLPRKPQGRKALADAINLRHRKRKDAIQSRLQKQRRQDHPETATQSASVTLSNYAHGLTRDSSSAAPN